MASVQLPSNKLPLVITGPKGPLNKEPTDPLAEWREPDDIPGGNIAEMRKVMAEVEPPDAPARADPDDRVAAGVSDSTHNLRFENLVKNDIAGEGMRFEDVATLNDRAIDAVVTASNYAAAVPSKTGIRGKVGNVNLDSNTQTTFTMRFVDRETDEPVAIGEFFFSVFDIDSGFEGPITFDAHETLTISGWKEYFLIPQDKGGELSVKNLGHGSASFTGTVNGKESDNPTDPLLLTDMQAARTVNFKYAPGKSSISWTYKVTKTYEDGRNFQFGGMTMLYFCKAPKVNLDFSFSKVMRSNLGNQGPQFDEPEGVLFHRIATVGEQIIDLEINALDQYMCYACHKNGKYGMFGQVNMNTPMTERAGKAAGKGAFNGEVRFKFSLYKGGTKEPYSAEWLYWSMFDLDQAKPNKQYNPKWQESFTVSDFSTFMTASDTEIITEKLSASAYRFNSSKKGTGKDNPKDPLNLPPVAMKRAITFVFRNKNTWSAKFTLGVPDYTEDGRNFLFAGKSSTATCDKNTYGDVVNVPAAAAALIPDPNAAEAEAAEKAAREAGASVD